MTCVEGVEGVNLSSGFFSKRSLLGENPEMTFTLSTLSTPSTSGCRRFHGEL